MRENKNHKQKIIVIGLDGASPKIFFDKWKEEFPNIKKIKEKGWYGKLKSTTPPVTGPAWASFATGCNPGKHGIFDFLYQDPATGDLRPITSRNIKTPTIYEILKEHGMNSILINLPVSYPPKTDDIILTSLLTRGDEFVFPKKLKYEIPELQKYRIVPDLKFYVDFNRKKFIEDIHNLERDKFEIAKKLFKRNWNLFFILFSGTDWIQHKFYYGMIKRNRKKNQQIIHFYKELDSYIGWFLENKDENTHLFIISDHGFKVYEGTVGINNLLEKYDYLRFKKSEEKEILPTRRRKEISQKLENKRMLSINPVIWKILSKNKLIIELSRGIYNLFFQKRFKFHTAPQKKDVDIESSKAYCRSSESSGIYIKNGHKNIKDELIKKLNREKIFSDIKERIDIYNGPYIKYAPDIILWSEKYVLAKTQFESIIKKNTNGHDYYGIFLLDSLYIKNKKYINRELTDIAPTILHILGIDYKKYDLDGKSIV